MQGIYLITNTINGHKYVGRSVDITKRWSQHVYSSNREDGFYLHRAIKAHGVDKFEFKVLEEVENKADLEKREEFWYKQLNPEYNLISPEEAPSNVQKIKIKSKDVNSGLIETYGCINEAARKMGVSKTAISSVLKGKRNTSCGRYWAYENEDFVIPIDRGNNGERRVSVVIKKDDLVLEFPSISDCGRYLNVSPSLITNILNGKSRAKRARGFTVELNL